MMPPGSVSDVDRLEDHLEQPVLLIASDHDEAPAVPAGISM
jgi:hypothetical protein